MTFYLSIQNTYTSLEVALFDDDQILQWATEDKMTASKNFISLIVTMLNKHQLALSNISFIAVNQGPGPFTTLRVVIASVNGLSFASKIPLIGIDGIDALLLEHRNAQHPNTVAFLNAFNGDVYFGIQKNNSIAYEKGYGNIANILEKIKEIMPDQSIRFLGNGAHLYAQEIDAAFGNNATIPDPLPGTCTVQQIGLMGWEKWQEKTDLHYQLFPLYLKQAMI